MPIAPTYPGVYIQELKSGVHTITGVATSIAAFIGRAASGPTDAPTVINSFADYQRQFGGLSLLSSISFAVRDFFANGGSQAVIVRLNRAGGQLANSAAAAGNAATTPAGVLAAIQANVNSLGAADKPAATGVLTAATAAEALAGSTADSVKKAAANAAAQSGKPFAIVTAGTLILQATSPGSWANGLQVRVEKDPKDPVGRFKLLVRDSATGNTETFSNLAVSGADRVVDKVLEQQSLLVRVSGSLPVAPPAANDPATPPRSIWDDNSPATFYGVAKTDLADDGSYLTAADFTGAEHFNSKTGLYALHKTDLFNLLSIPPYLPDGSIDESIIDEVVGYCQARRALFLIDPPPAWPVLKDAGQGVVNNIGASSSYAAVFFPRLNQPNALHDNQMEAFVPSGAVAGVMARTDAQRGVWKAPAGIDATLTGVPSLAVTLSDAENGQLNPLGVNCLRTFPGVGRVVWGARTREGDDRKTSEWKYIPVRRTALFIEESLFRGTQWIVFEPNDEPLWAQIRLNIGAFLQGLFRQGAFQGKTPQEAYFVKCDGTTTTQNDIDRGIVNIIVGFAPLKPAEFVVIKLQQMAGQLEV